MDRLLIGSIERATESRVLIPRLSDDELIDRYRDGDEQAFVELFERYHAEVVAYCTRFLGDRGEADDAAQQAFISAHGFMRRNSSRIAFRQWIYTIARNKSLSLIRSRKQHLELQFDEVSRQPSLATAVEVREELRDVVDDLRHLPEEQRSAMTLAQLEGLRGEDIAEILGCSHDRVRALIFQARQSLNARREARKLPCADVRAHIDTVTKRQLSGVIRRHVELCDGCAELWHDRRTGAASLAVGGDGRHQAARRRVRRFVAGAAIALAALLVGRAALAVAGAEPWSHSVGGPDTRVAAVPHTGADDRRERRDVSAGADQPAPSGNEITADETQTVLALFRQAPSAGAPPIETSAQRGVGEDKNRAVGAPHPGAAMPGPVSSPAPDVIVGDGPSPAEPPEEAPQPSSPAEPPPPVAIDGESPTEVDPEPVVPDPIAVAPPPVDPDPVPVVPPPVDPDPVPVVPDPVPSTDDPPEDGSGDSASQPVPVPGANAEPAAASSGAE